MKRHKSLAGPFILTAPTGQPKPANPCKKCGGKVEAVPMMPDTCYDCYRSMTPEQIKEMREQNQQADYCQTIISGGEVLELSPATHEEAIF